MLDEETSLQSLRTETLPLNPKRKLSFIRILGIAASNVAPNLLYMILPIFFQPLSTKLLIPKIWNTTLLFISSFMGFVVSPLIGVYSDSCMFKWGRRRIYIVISLIIMLIGLITMTYCSEIGKFLKPQNSLLLRQIIFGISYELSVTSGNMLDPPTRSICTDVTPVDQQNIMSNVSSVYGALGKIIVLIIGSLGLEKYFHLQQMQFVLITSSLICSISILITIVSAHEEPLKVKPPKVRPFKQIFDSCKNLPKPIIHILPSFLCSSVAYYQYYIQFSHFMAHEIFNGDNTSSDQEKIDLYDKGLSFAMICGAVRSSAQFTYGFCCAKISEVIGFRLTTFLGYLCITVCFFLFLFVNNRYAFLGISVFIGIGYHTINTMPTTIMSICTSVMNLDFGSYYGILIMISVVGEQISNIGIGTLLAKIWPNNSRMMIVVSSSFGFISMILSYWIIEPPERNNSIISNNDVDGYKEID